MALTTEWLKYAETGQWHQRGLSSDQKSGSLRNLFPKIFSLQVMATSVASSSIWICSSKEQ